MSGGPPSARATVPYLVAGWTAVAGGVLAVGWLLTGPLAGWLDPREDRFVRWLAARRTDAWDTPVEVLSYLGDTVSVLTVGPLLVGLTWWWTRWWWAPLFVVLANVGERGVYLAATALISRDRPPVRILDPGLVPDHSYPSGHVAAAVALWGSVVVAVWFHDRAEGRWLTPLLVIPLVVLACRLYQGAHHPSDTVVSLVYPAVWLAVVARLLLWARPRPPSRTERARRGARRTGERGGR